MDWMFGYEVQMILSTTAIDATSFKNYIDLQAFLRVQINF